MKYDAFISYRHTPLDLEMAKKVHSGLETYHVPAAVQKKTGKKKIQRVFRDQEELPIGSDLDDNITAALKESEYLIVICSPNTPGSVWVCKEIETFIKLHDRNHVLAVLIEGEPNESFPQQLLVDENGAPVEPLAADVRGDNSAERNKKFKTEILRLAAPVLGCTYDDLKQRHKERIIRRMITFISAGAAVIALAGAAFGIYNASVAAKMTALANEKAQLADEKTQLADEKTQLAEEVMAEFVDKQINQSKFYAELSQTLFKAGDRENAVLVAMEGLPSEDNDRPYVAEAEYALADALYAYADGFWYSQERVLHHDTTVKEMYRDADNTKLITIDANSTVYVWDASNWQQMAKISAGTSDSGYIIDTVAASADSDYVYVCSEEALIKYDYEGNQIYRTSLDDEARIAYFSEENGIAVVITFNSILKFDLETGQFQNKYTTENGNTFSSTSDYNRKTNELVCAQYDFYSSRIYYTYVNLSTDECSEVLVDKTYIMDIKFTSIGNILVVSTLNDVPIDIENATMALYDTESNQIWKRPLGLPVNNYMSADVVTASHNYELDGEQYSEIIYAVESKYITLDENTGFVVASGNLASSCNDIWLAATGELGFTACADGSIQVMDFHRGIPYDDYTVYTELNLMEMCAFSKQLVCRGKYTSELKVYSMHEAPDLESLGTISGLDSCLGADPYGRYYIVKNYVSSEYELGFYDFEGNLLYTYDINTFADSLSFLEDGTMVCSEGGRIVLVNPLQQTAKELTYESLGLNAYSKEVYVANGGKYCVAWDTWDVGVIDLEQGESLYHQEFDAGHRICSATITPDGQTLYVGLSNEPMLKIDVATGVESVFSDDSLKAGNISSDKRVVVVTLDGKYVALGCSDGYIRIVDVDADTVISSLDYLGSRRTFMEFTTDGRHLIYQGDDCVVYIWDMEKKVYSTVLNYFNYMIDRVICDDEEGMFALGEGYNIVLFERENCGKLAIVADAVSFLPSSNKFFIRCSSSLYACTYKDYHQLIELANEQFPGAMLSEADKTEYNID